MCESEFLLVKQAAAERLGVSPDRLRVKFFSKTIEEQEINFYPSLFFLMSVSSAFANSNNAITVDGNVDFIPMESNFNFFCSSLLCTSAYHLSGYLFEVV